jgi:hypothetical protein
MGLAARENVGNIYHRAREIVGNICHATIASKEAESTKKDLNLATIREKVAGKKKTSR